MRAFLLGMMLAAGVAPLPTEAAAQTRPSPNCSDDRGVDRCSAEQQQRVRELFGVQPIEELQAAGAQVRRAFYVDGYGRDMVAIAFVRAPGRDPMLFVHYPREGDILPTPATALVPASTWERVLSGSAHFDRALVSEPPASDPDVFTVCLHSWVYSVEAVDPAVGRAGPKLRREVEDSCQDGLAAPYAGELAELALPLLPYCAALDPEQHRNTVSLLKACRLLNGDRMAAAEAFNLLSELRYIDQGERAVLNQVFGQSVVLDWAGEQISGGMSATADAWYRRVTEGERTSLYIDSVTGVRADQVRAEGQLVKYVDGSNDERVQMVAPVTFQLEDSRDGLGLRLSRATVGAFRQSSDD